jgi:hypothetical protein
MARKQVLWDYIIATSQVPFPHLDLLPQTPNIPQHARVSFNGRTDESGTAKPAPYEGDQPLSRPFKSHFLQRALQATETASPLPTCS